MITEITLKNFKCFKEKISFPLSKINLLTGINGRGKSTLLQSLLLMRQTIEHNPNSNQVIFNGSCLRLGTFEDVKNSETSIHEPIFMYYKNKKYNKESAIEYSLFDHPNNELIGDVNKIGIDNKFFVRTQNSDIFFEDLEGDEHYDYGYYNINYLKLIHHSVTHNDKNPDSLSQLSFGVSNDIPEFHHIHYIAADRIGPKDYHPKNNLGEFINVGPQGENTAIVLARKQEDIVYDTLYLGTNAKTVLQQTEEWLNKIFDGAKIELVVESSTISINYNTQSTKKRYKSSNVGFGYSYILPIIVSGLIAKEDEILIIENPEAHLHPKAQSQLTKFLAKVASCGVQVFIESHSEHILNALRIVSLDNAYNIDNEDISVLYFKSDTEEPFIKLNIEKNGSIKNWVDGFFDQQELDLSEIFKLSKGRK